MSDYPVTRGSRAGDPHLRLRLAALTAVIAGVVLVALAAFLLSYEGIHQIALQAGVSPTLAKLYPLMLDAMLVVACSAALALRNAGWWTKFYVWVSLLLLLGALAAGDALHATGVRLTSQPARAAIAIIPWVLLLMGFGMWLVMLRQWRKIRAAAAASRSGAPSGTGASNGTGDGHAGRAVAGSAAAGSATTWAGGRGAAPAATGAHRAGMDTLLERPADLAPDRAPAPGVQAAGGRPTPGDKPALPRRPPVPGQRIPTGAAGAIGARAAAARAGAARARDGAARAAGTTEAETASTETAETRTTEAGTTEAETASTETAETRTTEAGTTEAETASTETAETRTTEAGTTEAETASTETASTGTAGSGTTNAGTGTPSSGTTGGAAGASAAGQDGGRAESPGGRDGAGRGDGSGLPPGALTEDDSSFRLLPTSTRTKAPVEGTTSGQDTEPDHAASSAATGDHFDRMRSTPTPPGDDGE
jgi:hypothetical protein